MSSYLQALRNVAFKPLTMGQRPIHIQLEPTTYCNLNCKACTRLTFLQQFRHLRLEQFTQIAAQIRPLKISLSGAGEPFLNPELFEMIRFAKSMGCSINTTTNCTLLTPELCAQIVQSGLDLLKISIDGATRATYQQSRREDRFEQVIAGIRALTRAKQERGSATPFIRFNYVIFAENYHELAETVKLAERLGVNAIYFQPLELIGIEERFDDLVGNLTQDALASEIRRALAVRAPSVKTNLRILQRNLPRYWKKYQLATAPRDPRICILPWFSTYITLEGTVHPCCSCSQPETIMGNILETPLDEIWNGKKYRQFRQAIRAGKRPYPICTNCVPETLLDIVRSASILPGFLL